MGRLTHRPLSSGNAVELLVNGDEAYPAMLEAIDSAPPVRRALVLHLQCGLGGEAVRRGHGRARGEGRRGPRPGRRGRGPLSPADDLRRRCARRVSRAEAFLPSILPTYFPYFNLRCHRKVLVIDGQVGFTGGMNIDESFYSPSHPEVLRHDLHFRLEGPVVDTMRQVFADDWAFRTGEVLNDAAWSCEARDSGPALARGVIDGPDDNLDQLAFSPISAR